MAASEQDRRARKSKTVKSDRSGRHGHRPGPAPSQCPAPEGRGAFCDEHDDGEFRGAVIGTGLRRSAAVCRIPTAAVDAIVARVGRREGGSREVSPIASPRRVRLHSSAARNRRCADRSICPDAAPVGPGDTRSDGVGPLVAATSSVPRRGEAQPAQRRESCTHPPPRRDPNLRAARGGDDVEAGQITEILHETTHGQGTPPARPGRIGVMPPPIAIGEPSKSASTICL